MGHTIAAVGALNSVKSSLSATAGGKGPEYDAFSQKANNNAQRHWAAARDSSMDMDTAAAIEPAQAKKAPGPSFNMQNTLDHMYSRTMAR